MSDSNENDEQNNELDTDIQSDQNIQAIVQNQSVHSHFAVFTNKANDKKESVPLWLITFTDIMALMLTFFVLLYAMSVPQENKWQEITDSLSSKFDEKYSKRFHAGSQDVIEIDRIDTKRALDLTYLRSLMNNLLKSKQIKDVIIFQNGNRLVVSLPSELLFESGKVEINLEGKKALFSLGGALTRVKNRIEVVGHTDPTPMSSKAQFSSNWELSMARAASVAAMLKEVGYEREIIVRGLSSARYDEMSSDIPEQQRYNMARRVDIILMEDSGARNKFMTVQ